MLGRHTYFRIQPSEAGSHAATRYRDQARRVFEVLDRHLSTRDWLAAGRYTIADVATYPWVGSPTGLGFDWTHYPSLHARFERRSDRSAAIRFARFRVRLFSDIPVSCQNSWWEGGGQKVVI